MATHAGVALELGIARPQEGKSRSFILFLLMFAIHMVMFRICMSPQMEAILIWCQCRTREYDVRVK